MTPELKNCPLCDGVAQITKGHATREVWRHGEFHRAFCTACQVRQLFYKTPDEAADAWNRRAAPQAVVGDPVLDDRDAKIAKYESRMLRMAGCAGEFARDACAASTQETKARAALAASPQQAPVQAQPVAWRYKPFTIHRDAEGNYIQSDKWELIESPIHRSAHSAKCGAEVEALGVLPAAAPTVLQEAHDYAKSAAESAKRAADYVKLNEKLMELDPDQVPQAAPVSTLKDEQIDAMALAKGFKQKPQPDGTMALNSYVFLFARAIEAHVRAQQGQDSVDAARYRWLLDEVPCNISDGLGCGISEISDDIDAAIERIRAQNGSAT